MGPAQLTAFEVGQIKAHVYHGLGPVEIQKNNQQSTFQKALYDALLHGRTEMNNVFLLGDKNTARSFLQTA